MRTCTVCANNLSCDFFDDYIDPGLLSQLRAFFDLHNTFNSARVIVALCSFDFKATQRKPFFTVPCLMLSNFAPKPRCLLAPMATLALRVHEHLGVRPWVPPGFPRCIGYPTHIPSIPVTLARNKRQESLMTQMLVPITPILMSRCCSGAMSTKGRDRRCV